MLCDYLIEKGYEKSDLDGGTEAFHYCNMINRDIVTKYINCSWVLDNAIEQGVSDDTLFLIFKNSSSYHSDKDYISYLKYFLKQFTNLANYVSETEHADITTLRLFSENLHSTLNKADIKWGNE